MEATASLVKETIGNVLIGVNRREKRRKGSCFLDIGEEDFGGLYRVLETGYPFNAIVSHSTLYDKVWLS